MNTKIKVLSSALFSVALLASVPASAAVVGDQTEGTVPAPKPGEQSQTPPSEINPKIKDQDHDSNSDSDDMDHERDSEDLSPEHDTEIHKPMMPANPDGADPQTP